MKKIFIFIATFAINFNLTTFFTFKKFIKSEEIIIDISACSGRDSSSVPTLKSGFVNNFIYKLDYTQYASEWSDFVFKYPHFRFINSKLKVSFIENYPVILLDDQSYDTNKLYVGNTNFYMIAENRVTNIWNNEYISLSAKGSLLENIIYFGIYYDFYLIRDHNDPIPTYESSVQKLVFYK